jgi:hypothetical protein
VRTNFYIDGFNLYYLALKGTLRKWLDLYQFCQDLAPAHQVNRIRYFTTLVKARKGNLQQPIRQKMYLRALATIPVLTIHYGQFRDRQIFRPLVTPIPGYPRTVEIWNTEEKGTDVNLASYLLMDGVDGDYEQAIVISNDADLALPIGMVRDKLKFPIGIVNPNLDQKAHTPKELSDAATFVRRLRPNTLRNCQFPSQLQDSTGVISKPTSW